MLCVRMCGPTPVKVGTSDTVEATKGGTGIDQSSSTGLFVLSIEHLHGGGGVLLFVIVFVFVFGLAWWCARRRMSVVQPGVQQQQQQQQPAQVVLPLEEAGVAAGGDQAWAPGWAPT